MFYQIAKYVSIFIIIACVFTLCYFSLRQQEPHLQPVDGELIQTYKDTISDLHAEIEALEAQNQALRQEKLDILQEHSSLADGYFDRLIDLLNDNKNLEGMK